MRSISFKMGVMLALLLLSAIVTNAQRRRPAISTSPNRPTVIAVSPDSLNGLPVIIDSSAMLGTVNPQSIRPTGSFGLAPPENRIPLGFENLRRDDALYVQKVWREIDFREKINQSFRYDAMNDQGSQLFINILLRALKTGQVQAFKDDRFSILITGPQVADMTSGRTDTVMRYNPTTMLPDAYIVTRTGVDTRAVNKLLIMEEWVFDSKGSRMHCRIIGMAPLKTRLLPEGKQTEASSLMCWVSYSDLRPLLANAEVYNPKNMGADRMTWEELFESRMFSSYIVKSTIDNAANLPIRYYIHHPILALLEGDNVREKIFNYEQDLWSY